MDATGFTERVLEVRRISDDSVVAIVPQPDGVPAAGEAFDPGQPGTATALYVMWAERDARYASLDRALTVEQIDSIRGGRKREADMLRDRRERARAWARAATWYPPQHGQGY